MVRILVVEDDQKLNHIVCAFLRDNGYEAIGCTSAMAAFDALMDNIIDLILSDIMMPEMDGFEFAGLVREQNKTIPLLFMTARDDISAKQKGFRIGIDDYMVKPIDMDELLLRVGALRMDADEMTAYLREEEVPLTVKEFNILYKLLSYPRRTFTRNQLIDEFWGVDVESTPRTVDVYINKIRDKLSECGDFEIVTVHGLGYKAVLK